MSERRRVGRLSASRTRTIKHKEKRTKIIYFYRGVRKSLFYQHQKILSGAAGEVIWWVRVNNNMAAITEIIPITGTKGRNCGEMTIRQAVDLLNRKEITIPPWQRDVTWNRLKRQRFIKTVMEDDPVPQILLRMVKFEGQWVDGKPHFTNITEMSLEDGRQRLSALADFCADRYPTKDEAGGSVFSRFSDAEKEKFYSFKIPYQRYWGASNQKASQIFIIQQEGVPLTVGEKLHAVNEYSPTVEFAKQMLMTAGFPGGFHDEAVEVWGSRCDEMVTRHGLVVSKDKGRKGLVTAFAIIAGCAWGPADITKKWGDISGLKVEDYSMMTRPFQNVLKGETVEETKARVKRFLRMILDIFKSVQLIKPWSRPGQRNKQFDPGFAMGYIIHSLHHYGEDDWPMVKDKWVKFLVDERNRATASRYPFLLSQPSIKFPIEAVEGAQQVDMPMAGKGRSWLPTRWQNGHNLVFGIGEFAEIEGDDSDAEDEEET